MKIIKDKFCTFCKREEETIEHVFYDCDMVMVFWSDFELYYRDECMNGHLKQKDVILGYSCNTSYLNINQNIIYAKYYLYLMKLKEELPNFKFFLDMKNVIKIC